MKFNNCDLDTLGQFLAARPDASVILDTKIDGDKDKKEDAADFFGEISRHLTEKYNITLDRIIPQGYSLAQTRRLKKAGYPHVIFTLYKVRDPNDYIEACRLEGVAITANIQWVTSGRLKVNDDGAPVNCPIFVHPVGKLDILAKAMAIAPQIRGIYTAFLRPE